VGADRFIFGTDAPPDLAHRQRGVWRTAGGRLIIEDEPGASGRIAVQNLARSSPDGCTLGLVTTSTNAVSAAVNPALPYDLVKSFSAIGLIGSPYALTVKSGLPSNNVDDLVGLANDPRSLQIEKAGIEGPAQGGRS
jgi:tripartite-type tricarboxylate transporter receptor subunit TctC